MKRGNTTVEQVDKEGFICIDYDTSLSVTEIYDRIKQYFPHIYKSGDGMICGEHSGKKYSTPIKYCGKVLNAQAFDDYLYVYDNTELIVIHQISKDNVKKIELAEHALEKAEYSLMRSGQSIKEFAENNLKELGEMYK